eukprot:g38158.t1
MRSSPVTYKVRVGEVVLNKRVGPMKAATSQTGRGRNIAGPSEQPERLPETLGSPPPRSVKETSESEKDAASIPLLPEEEEEFLPRPSGRKRQATVLYAPSRVRVRGTGSSIKTKKKTMDVAVEENVQHLTNFNQKIFTTQPHAG